jgi:hypothetical protein
MVSLPKLMLMKYINALLCLSLIFAGCGGEKGANKSTGTDSTKLSPYPAIALQVVGNSPEYPDANLQMANVKAQPQGKDSTKLSFEFTVKNYELKMQTADTGNKMCNNSAKGQHIHFILDNQAYQALYEPKNEIVVANNSEHFLMAFLSRSYHESIKSKGAGMLYHFKVNEKGKLQKTPMLFYSRPKGDYIGKDTANVLLDFYVWNASLAADAYKVKAHISNADIPQHDTTITITNWKPNFIKHLGIGKCAITLTLIDKDGKNLEGPNTTVTRKIQLAAAEPLKK